MRSPSKRMLEDGYKDVLFISCTSDVHPPSTVEGHLIIARTVPNSQYTLLDESGTVDRGDRPWRIVAVPPGTKLSKLKAARSSTPSRLICVCDPDTLLRRRGALSVIEAARGLDSLHGRCVVFGIVRSQYPSTLVGRACSVDKWWSHEVLRPLLWRLRVGITLPGQFIAFSGNLLDLLEPRVDSSLDDLYLGLTARRHGYEVVRLPIVVGYEEVRSGWTSLLAQRIRWMKGFVSLLHGHLGDLPGLALLICHGAIYHVLPIAWLVCLAAFAAWSWASAAAILLCAAGMISVRSRHDIAASLVFLLSFPLIHVLAIGCSWIPLPDRILKVR